MPTSATFKPPTPPVAPSDYPYNFAASQPLFSPSSAFGLPPTSSALDDFSFLNSFTAPSPASTSSSFSNTLATPPDDLFSAYRDNGPASFSELDNLFAGTDDLGAYLTSPSPPAAAVKSVEKPKEVSLPPLSSCTLGIKGETYEFDVDGLCAEYVLLLPLRDSTELTRGPQHEGESDVSGGGASGAPGGDEGGRGAYELTLCGQEALRSSFAPPSLCSASSVCCQSISLLPPHHPSHFTSSLYTLRPSHVFLCILLDSEAPSTSSRAGMRGRSEFAAVGSLVPHFCCCSFPATSGFGPLGQRGLIGRREMRRQRGGYCAFRLEFLSLALVAFESFKLRRLCTLQRT